MNIARFISGWAFVALTATLVALAIHAVGGAV